MGEREGSKGLGEKQEPRNKWQKHVPTTISLMVEVASKEWP